MYLVAGLCKLGTSFCAYFNSKDVRNQCIQLQVHCDCSENAFHFKKKLRIRKVLTLHGNVLVTLVSQTTFCLRLVFDVPRGDHKKQFLLCHISIVRMPSFSFSSLPHFHL